MPDLRQSRLLHRWFAEHGGSLVRFLTQRSGNAAEAEDLAQEAWLRLQRLERIDDVENPRAFLFQTAVNLTIDRQRHRKLAAAHEQSERARYPDGHLTTLSPERAVGASQQLEQLDRALEALPQNARQAFIMHRGRGMTYSEIAAVLDVSTSMVEKYIMQALRHCRQSMDSDDG